jgi:hypothetical protein
VLHAVSGNVAIGGSASIGSSQFSFAVGFIG